jgi:hypothetical protein
MCEKYLRVAMGKAINNMLGLAVHSDPMLAIGNPTGKLPGRTPFHLIREKDS